MSEKLIDYVVPFLDQLGGEQSHANRYNHARRLRDFLYHHGRAHPNEITAAHVNAWHNQLRARGYANATLAGYRQALKAFLAFALGAEHPARHLATGSFTAGKQKLPPEADVIRATITAETWLHSEDSHQVRDATIFLLSKVGGPRQGEIQNLRRSEVESALAIGADAYGVYHAKSTGKTKDIIIRFNELVAYAFRCWLLLRPPRATIDRCFVTLRPIVTPADPVARYRPLSRTAATNTYRHVCHAAGVKPILSHALRHRLGNSATNNHSPKVAAILLNHKDWQTAATAITFYHHPDEADVSLALATIGGGSETGEMARLFGVSK